MSGLVMTRFQFLTRQNGIGLPDVRGVHRLDCVCAVQTYGLTMSWWGSTSETDVLLHAVLFVAFAAYVAHEGSSTGSVR